MAAATLSVWIISLSFSSLSFFLPIYLSTYLSIFLPIYLSFYLSIFLPIYLSFYLYIYLSTYLSFYLSIYLSTYLYFYRSIFLTVFLSIYLPVFIFIYILVEDFISDHTHRCVSSWGYIQRYYDYLGLHAVSFPLFLSSLFLTLSLSLSLAHTKLSNLPVFTLSQSLFLSVYTILLPNECPSSYLSLSLFLSTLLLIFFFLSFQLKYLFLGIICLFSHLTFSFSMDRNWSFHESCNLTEIKPHSHQQSDTNHQQLFMEQ